MTDSTFPPRWDRPHFKPAVRSTTKARRRVKGRKAQQKEAESKGQVRKRDRYCRFPLCGCDDFKLARHVAHLQHKGMGGDPKGHRSKPHLMIVLCIARHRESTVSLDRGTVRITPLTSAGTAGACVFEVDLGSGFVEVGREHALHEFDPFTPEQRSCLLWLARARMLG